MKFGKHYEEQLRLEYVDESFPYGRLKAFLKDVNRRVCTQIFKRKEYRAEEVDPLVMSVVEQVEHSICCTYEFALARSRTLLDTIHGVSDAVGGPCIEQDFRIGRSSSASNLSAIDALSITSNGSHTSEKDSSPKKDSMDAKDNGSVPTPHFRPPEESSIVLQQLERVHASTYYLLENFVRLNSTAIRKFVKKVSKFFPEHAYVDKLEAIVEKYSFGAFVEKCNYMMELVYAIHAKLFSGGSRSRSIADLQAAVVHSSSGRGSRCGASTKKGFIIDMDGTIYKDGVLLPGVLDFVDWLKRENKKFLFLTNASERTPQQYQKKLQRLGIEVHHSHFWTSAMATADWLASQTPRGTAYVIGGQGLVSALYSVGFTLTDDNPDYVVLGETEESYNFQTIQKAIHLISNGSRFVVTNSDDFDASKHGPVPSCGALKLPIEIASERKGFSVGKPNPLMMRHAIDMLCLPREDVCIVGDRMDTDIRAGCTASVTTCLVLTGVTRSEDLPHWAFKPDYVFANVGEIVHSSEPASPAVHPLSGQLS